MEILFASPDRDMLMTYGRLLSEDGHEVVTVFDGTQMLAQLAAMRPGLVVFDLRLPRIDNRSILSLLNEEGIPVLALTEERPGPAELSDSVLAGSYLAYPFLPEEFQARYLSLIRRAASDAVLRFGDISFPVSGFCLSDGIRLTNEEIDVFAACLSGGTSKARHPGTYVTSLNNKFRQAGKHVRIEYILGEGFQAVTEHE